MYLLDTNIWLERLLDQANAQDVKQLLDGVDSSELALSDFSLHSVCVILGHSHKLSLLASISECGVRSHFRKPASSLVINLNRATRS